MMDYSQLAALRAIIHTGSFETAASRLGVTPSAISQRIKTLEDHLGVVLIIRGTPATATPAGQRLFRHAEEVALLETALGAELNGGSKKETAAPIRMAVNADSLATWFINALDKPDGFLFDIITCDEDTSAEWLRRGEVIAAVTAHAKPVQGCESVPLGSLRYLATASPEFAAKHFPEGITQSAAKHAPMLSFDRNDHLQLGWLTKHLGCRATPPLLTLPSTHGFVTATLKGLAWGLNPEVLVREHIAAGRLVAIGSNPVQDVPLFWQFNRVTGQALQPVTDAVTRTARQWLEHAP